MGGRLTEPDNRVMAYKEERTALDFSSQDFI